MNDLFRRYLEPDDDGRAFTEAVLLRAAGALHRRRAAGGSAAVAPWAALEAWARPWIIAAIVGLAMVLALPGLQGGQAPSAATPTLTADLVGASTGTAYVLAETLGN